MGNDCNMLAFSDQFCSGDRILSRNILDVISFRASGSSDIMALVYNIPTCELLL